MNTQTLKTVGRKKTYHFVAVLDCMIQEKLPMDAKTRRKSFMRA